MPTQKILSFVVAIIVLIGVIFGASYLMDSYSEAPEEITYILQSIQDGTYDGEVPPLDHEIEFSTGFPEENKAELKGLVAETTSHLKRYPYDGTGWMELALRYHTAGDYRAAEKVWVFVTSQPPKNVTALGNLGRVNHFEFKEFEKAETYFKQAIEANPDRKEAYFELFDLYRYSYKKDTTAAVDIMKEGAARFPEDSNFPAALGTYYRDTGRPNQARAQFEKAIEIARETGDMGAVEGFTQELSRL